MKASFLKTPKTGKLDTSKILLILLSLTLIGTWSVAALKDKTLKMDTDGLALIEYINSGVQRVSKLELEYSTDHTLIVDLERATTELIATGSYFSSNELISEYVADFVDSWADFKKSVLDFRTTTDRDALFVASELNYKKSIDTVSLVSSYIAELEKTVNQYEMYAIVNVFAIAFFLLKLLFTTVAELKKNKELSASMFIDTSTGLYNRSKCQEILKNCSTPEFNKERAVVIFDLNDLKKTNDGLGHRAGDDLIASFAEQLKNATSVLPYETFVGRYGGDEFMAYFASTVEQDVKLYIKEVDYLMAKFNEEGTKPFKLSCAAGYSITTAETKSLTMRELFDNADETMYKNKLAMKERKRQELAEKGIVEPTVIDERLL